MDEGFDYHLAKDITQALATRPDLLAVGGLFGIVGLSSVRLLLLFSAPLIPIALTVVLSAFLARVAFGYDIVGEVAGANHFDMTPFETGETRPVAPSEEPAISADGGTVERMATEPWLPVQYTWGHVAMIGLVAGVLGAFIAIETGGAFIVVGISAAALTFLVLAREVPVTHHVTLPASTAALAVVALGPLAALLVGTAFGITGALGREVLQRLCYAHGHTHVDPPAFAIAVNTLAIAVLTMIGVFPSAARGRHGVGDPGRRSAPNRDEPRAR